MTRTEEQALVSAAQADSQQFEALYQAFVNEVYRFIYYKVNIKEVAEDLTSQVFMQVLEHISNFRYQTGARFSSWLYQIARNAVIDYYRKDREAVNLEDVELPDAQPAVHMFIDQDYQHQRVKQVLQQLSVADQEILTLRLWQDKAYTEIAQIMQCNSVTARARYSRALKKFKQLYTTLYVS